MAHPKKFACCLLCSCFTLHGLKGSIKRLSSTARYDCIFLGAPTTMALETVVSTMSIGEVFLVVFACGFGALLIGAVGMGGVIILPALLVAGVEVSPAIVSIYVAFLPAALLKLLILGRVRGLIPWRAALSCGSTAAVGAALGGFLLSILSSAEARRALTFLVGAVAATAGLRDSRLIVQRKLRERRERRLLDARDDDDAAKDSPSRDEEKPSDSDSIVDVEIRASPIEAKENPNAPPVDPASASSRSETRGDRVARWYFADETYSIPLNERWEATRREMLALAVLGVLVGCASVLTGTGGPLIFIPSLMTMKGENLSRKIVVGCSSVLSGFLACAASASMLITGTRPDPGLTLLMAPCAIGGIVIGARVLQIASREFLQGSLTVLLLAIAALVLSKAALE
jgi:uncharacterized membrane protein YfcA